MASIQQTQFDTFTRKELLRLREEEAERMKNKAKSKK